VAGGRPISPRVLEPVGEDGSPSVVPSNPNGRVGRSRNPIAQGRDQMDATVVGIDVSKDRLDVSVRPAGTMLKFDRHAAGIESLIGELVAHVLGHTEHVKKYAG
jgi:transposase